jgi:hypothetical protein
MAKQYLLPCECGKAHPVTVAQAGRVLDCDCGRKNTVPTLAGLQRLEPVEHSAAKPKPAANWSSTRGMLFVVGVLLALLGLAAGGFGSFLMTRADVDAIDEQTTKIEQMQLDEISEMTPIQAYEVWERIRVMGPGVAGSAPSAQARLFRDFWLRVSVIGFSAAAIGILLAGGSLVGSQPKG